jgi:hypothetical protein
MGQRRRIRRQSGALGQIIPYPVSKALIRCAEEVSPIKKNERRSVHAMACQARIVLDRGQIAAANPFAAAQE